MSENWLKMVNKCTKFIGNQEKKLNKMDLNHRKTRLKIIKN